MANLSAILYWTNKCSWTPNNKNEKVNKTYNNRRKIKMNNSKIIKKQQQINGVPLSTDLNYY